MKMGNMSKNNSWIKYESLDLNHVLINWFKIHGGEIV